MMYSYVAIHHSQASQLLKRSIYHFKGLIL
ncbi:hypothetical protein [Legionella sp. WA2022007384]